MQSIPEQLPAIHRGALTWFVENQGATIGWPIILSDGTLLANKAKGIYKPAWTQYALSVKQTVNSPYSDRAPKFDENGNWTYLYYQEEQEGKDPESLSSNRAMLACMRDEIPVGVLRQLSPKPNVKYSILGIAQIIGKAAGYFMLEGKNKKTISFLPSDPQSFSYANLEIPSGVLQLGDLRIRKLRSVVQRQGQPRFRQQLMEIYDGKCAVSGCDVKDVLEAAHVVPYRGLHTNDTSNGILLRADLHILFDEGFLGIEPERLAVQLTPELRKHQHYANFDGVFIHRGGRQLEPELLQAHWHYCGFE